MMQTATITFRGEEREVEYKDYGYESDTNAQVIEWKFADLTPEQHDALKITEAEEQAIFETLSQNSYETAGDDW
ncbi:MAG TPA: hypothetical protein VM915_17295 [Verrucomicrobiae bacterium]|jgi:hypothetical protein|nr:hypothetical protein [Verrucomicrobiae bacterium]